MVSPLSESSRPIFEADSALGWNPPDQSIGKTGEELENSLTFRQALEHEADQPCRDP